MDGISIAGLVLGLGAIVGGQLLEGGHVSSLLQPTALAIVLGGTLGAVMLQSPRPVFVHGLLLSRWVFLPPPLAPEPLIAEVTRFSVIARKEGLLALEAQLANVADPFARRGLQLLVDGAEPERLREVLQLEIDSHEAKLRQAARIWEAAGGYAPTIGILGAVMGLIHVMENLSDPSRLGEGIAVAFVATIYGVGVANLVFLPVAKKLLASISRLASLREMYVDGLVAIANGDHPQLIEARMRSHFS